MFRGIFPRLKSIASAAYRFVLDTYGARLVIMSVKLWRDLPLLSFLVIALLFVCLLIAGTAARTVFDLLKPASASGIGPAIAAAIAALVVLELCAASAISGISAALQLAYDTGRHRIGTLLTIMTGIAMLVAAIDLSDGAGLSIIGVPVVAIAAAGLFALAIWFQRAYRKPAYPGFRDFRVDVIDARQFLTRATYGE